MKKLITLIAITALAFPANAAWDMFKAHDHDGDGSVSKEEWVAQKKKVAEKKGNEVNEEKVMKAFKRADTDGDGSLSREEVEALQAKQKKNK
jgi:Ca2+-binding EF-hand superfamily protein